jgi:ankyrin repeat protein
VFTCVCIWGCAIENSLTRECIVQLSYLLDISRSRSVVHWRTIMEASKNVFDLCASVKDKLVALKAFLEEHSDVDVNLYQDVANGGVRSIHVVGIRGLRAYMSVLIEANADLEVRDDTGFTALRLAADAGNLECVQVLIENKADVNTTSDDGMTPGHGAAFEGRSNCLHLLINAKANVNARNVRDVTLAMAACRGNRLTCLQLLVDAKADLNAKRNEIGTVYFSMRMPKEELANRVPGMPFAVLSCNTDSKNVRIDNEVTEVIVDTHINEYQQIHNFIDE